MGLAIGAEQMGKMGLLGGAARPSRTRHVRARRAATAASSGTDGVLGTGTMPGVFGQAGMEYAYQHDGVGFEQFAKVAEKNHAHSALNPLAQYQKVFTLEEIMDSASDLVPEHAADVLPHRRRRGGDRARVRREAADTRRSSSSGGRSRSARRCSPPTRGPRACQAQPDVNTLTRNAADKAYELAGVGPDDLDLVELHDCFATAELLHYDNLRLCEPGGAGDFIDSAAPWRDGTHPGQRVGRPASPRATRSA